LSVAIFIFALPDARSGNVAVDSCFNQYMMSTHLTELVSIYKRYFGIDEFKSEFITVLSAGLIDGKVEAMMLPGLLFISNNPVLTIS
jgi:hypothetical protein